MANNIGILDGSLVAQTVKTTDTASVHTPHQNVDAVIPGTGATNLGKAEDAAHASGDTGVMMLAVRKDTAAQLAGTDADYSPLITDSTGRLHVKDTLPDAAALADATANPTVPGVGAYLMGWNGSTWDRTQVDSAKNIKVTIPSGAAFPVKLEDAASADGDAGFAILAVRKATPANTSGTDGDYEMLQMDGGRLHTATAGSVAHDGADSGNPVKVGGRAVTAEITAVTAADRSDLLTDKVGKLIVLPYANPENFFSGASSSDITDTTSTQVIAAHGSLRCYITSISVSNLHASVDTRVDILDGNGGTVLWSGPAAHAGGGYTITFPVPLKGTAATRVDAKCGTTGAAVRVAIAGYYGA